MGNIHEGHRERVREKFEKTGLDNFQDHEIFEFLLFFTIPQSNKNETAHNLKNTFGSVSGVLDAPYELLCEVKGVGKKSALLIKLISSIIKRYMDDYTSKNGVIKSSEEAMRFMKYKFLCEQCECIYMVCLGNNGKVIFCSRIADGTPDSVNIIPSELIKTAIKANAVHVFLAHNHPNGISTPSSQDLRATNILYEEFRKVGLDFFDHIIVAPDGEYSMRQKKLFPGS